VQSLAPGMQHREEADVRAEMPRIMCHSQEGLGHGLEQTHIQKTRVLQHSWAQSMRQREHHMDVGDLEELRFAGSEPRRLRAALTVGARPIRTGFVGVRGVVTVVTRRRVAPRGGRPAGRKGPQDPPLLGRDSRAIAREIRLSILPDHVRHFEDGAAHDRVSRGRLSRGLGVAWRACGVTCKYRLVVWRVRWPRTRWKPRRSTPPSRRWVAKVLRNASTYCYTSLIRIDFTCLRPALRAKAKWNFSPAGLDPSPMSTGSLRVHCLHRCADRSTV